MASSVQRATNRIATCRFRRSSRLEVLGRCVCAVVLSCSFVPLSESVEAQGIFGNSANQAREEELFLLAPRALSRLPARR